MREGSPMSPIEADRIIKAGNPVTVHNPFFGETMTDVVFVRRDRFNIYTEDGGKFDRGELRIVKEGESR